MKKIITANIGAFHVNYNQLLANTQHGFMVAYFEINDFWSLRDRYTKEELYRKFHYQCKERLNLPYYFNSAPPEDYSKTSTEKILGKPKSKDIPRLYIFLDSDAIQEYCKGYHPNIKPFEFEGNYYQLYFEKSLSKIKLHVLVKLFLSHYFRHEKNLVYSSNEFWKILEGEKVTTGEPFHCLNIKILEENGQINGVPNATRFKLLTTEDLEVMKVKKNLLFQKFYTYNDHEDWDEYLFELKPSDARYLINHNFLNTEGEQVPVFKRYTKKGDKANTKYLNIDNEEYTRHGILYEFINDFRDYLINEFGVVVDKKVISYEFEKISRKGKVITPITKLSILDNRVKVKKRFINQNISSSGLANMAINELKKIHPSGEFMLHSKTVKNSSKTPPLLVLQDCEKSDFDKTSNKGILKKYTDPKQNLYKKFIAVPKQTLSINPNEQWNGDLNRYAYDQEYLDYDKVSLQKYLGDKGTALEVCLNQLTIKNILLNKVPVTKEPIFANDLLLRNYIYVHDNLALWVNNKGVFEWMEVVDLQTEAISRQFWKKIESFSGIDSDDIIGTILNQSSFPDKDHKNPFKSRYFMFGKNEFAEIKLTNDYILYDSPELRKRRDEMTKLRSLEELMLSSNKPPKLKSGSIANSSQIERYNNALSYCYNNIFMKRDFSYFDFVNLKLKKVFEGKIPKKYKKDQRLRYYIAKEIFDIKDMRNIQSHYGWESPKGVDVINLYDQFYINEEKGLYCVGNMHGFKYEMDKALRIRKLIVYQGNLKVRDLIYSMDILSIRHKQYTVYPYPFNFIKVIKG